MCVCVCVCVDPRFLSVFFFIAKTTIERKVNRIAHHRRLSDPFFVLSVLSLCIYDTHKKKQIRNPYIPEYECTIKIPAGTKGKFFQHPLPVSCAFFGRFPSLSLSLFLSLSLTVYIYVCVCVCVWRERSSPNTTPINSYCLNFPFSHPANFRASHIRSNSGRKNTRCASFVTVIWKAIQTMQYPCGHVLWSHAQHASSTSTEDPVPSVRPHFHLSTPSVVSRYS